MLMTEGREKAFLKRHQEEEEGEKIPVNSWEMTDRDQSNMVFYSTMDGNSV